MDKYEWDSPLGRFAVMDGIILKHQVGDDWYQVGDHEGGVAAELLRLAETLAVENEQCACICDDLAKEAVTVAQQVVNAGSAPKWYARADSLREAARAIRARYTTRHDASLQPISDEPA